MSVTAIIPTYNRNALLLGRSLPSVLDQTHRVHEVIVVADGMDGAQLHDLENGIEALDDDRIWLVNIERQQYPEDPGQKWCVLGLDARNRGLELAGNDHVAFLDDDDQWTRDHVEVLMRRLEETGADFAYGMSDYHWPDGRHQQAGRYPPGMGAFCDGAQLYRKGLGFRYDPECVSRGLPEDGDLWTRMFAAGVRFEFVPQVVHHYYPNPR